MNKNKLLVFLLLAAGSLCNANTMIYFGVFPKDVLMVDESTYQVVKKIELKTDAAGSLVLTADRKKLIAWTLKNSGLEVIDIAKGEVVDSWELGSPTKRVTNAGLAIDPTGNLLYANLTIANKLIDRWQAGTPKLAVIDLSQHKIIKEVEAEPVDMMAAYLGGNLRVSPDGKLVYRFGKEIAIFDATTLKKVDRIELEKSSFSNMDRIRFAPEVDPNGDPDIVNGIYNSEDPVMFKKMFGYATIHLNERKVDFAAIGPAARGVSNIRLSPDGKTAYAIADSGEHGDRYCQLWTIEVANKRLKDRKDFACRPGGGFTFAVSKDGKELLVAAGSDLEIYDPATMKMSRSLDLNGSISARMVAAEAPSSATP